LSSRKSFAADREALIGLIRLAAISKSRKAEDGTIDPKYPLKAPLTEKRFAPLLLLFG